MFLRGCATTVNEIGRFQRKSDSACQSVFSSFRTMQDLRQGNYIPSSYGGGRVKGKGIREGGVIGLGSE